ncbi:hypothetical protein SDC9_53253 [bioreactor metagenome]|uniref:Protein NO VEIN C-terminal domain-containing protein n=1 Tax=bioreactor metagenome TaxID=1076179 RepID=A0A644WTA3_9ZZZZ
MSSTSHLTQWAGQFGVAHEMTRRGYLVSFTMGNAPAVDLLCKSPAGTEFSVQVKSLKSKTFFLYQNSLLESKSNLFFVFVLVPVSEEMNFNLKPAEYFVLNRKQFAEAINEQMSVNRKREKQRGKPYAEFSPGISYSVLNKNEYCNAWINLPK